MDTRTQRQDSHPLDSDRGTTTVLGGAVTSIVGVAAGEIEGVHLSHGGTSIPGDTSPTVGEFVGNLTGSGSRIRGVSVEVGDRQAAVDLTVNVTYGTPIHRATEALRRNIINRVEGLTGLEVTEVNITVNDLTVPDGG